MFYWQCLSDLGPVQLDYLHCLCQCRQYGWHCISFCRAWTISTLAMLWCFIIIFLILVCWQPESMWSALSVQWQMGQFALGEKSVARLHTASVSTQQAEQHTDYIVTDAFLGDSTFSSLFSCHLWLLGRSLHYADVIRLECIPYRLNITAQKYCFLPCGVTARTKNIYLFWGCGIEKRGFLAYFGACQAKIPVRGWCKINISRVWVWCGSVKLKYFFGAADWTQVCTVC